MNITELSQERAADNIKGLKDSKYLSKNKKRDQVDPSFNKMGDAALHQNNSKDTEPTFDSNFRTFFKEHKPPVLDQKLQVLCQDFHKKRLKNRSIHQSKPSGLKFKFTHHTINSVDKSAKTPHINPQSSKKQKLLDNFKKINSRNSKNYESGNIKHTDNKLLVESSIAAPTTAYKHNREKSMVVDSDIHSHQSHQLQPRDPRTTRWKRTKTQEKLQGYRIKNPPEFKLTSEFNVRASMEKVKQFNDVYKNT